jgi:hypothetical protein
MTSAASQISCFREIIARRSHFGRHGLQQIRRILLTTNDGGPRLGEGLGAGELGNAVRGIDPLDVEHAFHAGAVVLRLKDRAKFLDDALLFGSLELCRAPEGRDDGACIPDLPERCVRAGQQDDAVERLRPAVAEDAYDPLWIGGFTIECAFAVPTQPRHAWPVRQGDGRARDIYAGHIPAAVKGDRPGEDVPVEAGFGQAVTDSARLADVHRLDRVEPGLQYGDLTSRRDHASVGHGKYDRRRFLFGAYPRGSRRQRQRGGDESEAAIAPVAQLADHALSLHETDANG